MGRKLSKLGYAVLFVVMTAMSALAALGGAPLFGFVGVLFFGGGGVVYFVVNRDPKPTRQSVVHGTLLDAERYTSRPAGIVFPIRRGYAVAITAGAVVFVLTGIWILFLGLLGFIFEPGVTSFAFVTIGAVTITFFGTCGILGIRMLFGAPGGIALLPEGLYARSPAGLIWLRWDDFAGGVIAGKDANAYIALSAKSPDAITLGGLNKRLHRINRWFSMDVGYPGKALGVEPALALDMIHYYLINPSARAWLADPAAADLRMTPR